MQSNAREVTTSFVGNWGVQYLVSLSTQKMVLSNIMTIIYEFMQEYI